MRTRTKENEGSTTSGAGGGYAMIERAQRRARGPRHGDIVAIAGEPEPRSYKVLGVDPDHGVALISRIGDGKTWRMPLSALKAI